MSLRIINDCRIEALAEKLVAELKSVRTATERRFEFLRVAVANPNLGNWLKMKVLAKVPELSAGIEMPFLDEVLSDCVKKNYKGNLELISGRDYPAFILDALLNHWRTEFVPFRKYVKESDGGSDVNVPLVISTKREARKAVQLAEKLARLIDAYEATEHLGLLASNKDKNDVYRGEQALVESLFGSEGADGLLALHGRISLRQMTEQVRDEKPNAVSKLWLFGQTSLTGLQLEILKWLSGSVEIVWFSPGRGNAVGCLPTWQIAAQKTFKAIAGKWGAEVEIVDEGNKPAVGDAVLSKFQNALMGGGLTEGVLNQDASIQVVGVPGIRREVELVYNAILGAVWERNENGRPVARKDMSFSDIGVLVSDMPKYRPMIEAVFDGRGQVPYGLVDATSKDYCSYLQGFLALMDVARYGLNRQRLFAVLENPCVQLAMGYSRDDVVKWRLLIQKYGAFDGYQEQDSDEQNASGHFNWEWALRRMRLGLVADHSGDGVPLEAEDVEGVCKLSEIVETLFRKLNVLNNLAPAEYSSDDAEKWPSTWAGRLHAVMDDFLAVEKDDSLEMVVRSRIVRALNGLKVISGKSPNYDLPVAAVEHFVSGVECAKGGYLRHGVTIGGLRSLAYVPFKQIFVLGLGEGGLPGQNDRSTLDVRNEIKFESRADVLGPEENRSRFFAAVTSARERLVLSYSNRELGSDAKLYPSSLINELKNALAKCVTHGEFNELEGYPLIESSEEIDTPDGKVLSCCSGEKLPSCYDGLLPTYSMSAHCHAVEKHDWMSGRSSAMANEQGIKPPSPKELAEFVKDPFTAILKSRYGISKEGYRDYHADETSPLGVQKGMPLWRLQTEIAKGHFDEAFAHEQMMSQMPYDILGDFAKSRLEKCVEWAKGISETDRARIGEDVSPSDAVAVVCRSFDIGSKKDPITLPPDSVLESLLSRLSAITDVGETPLDFAVKVIDVEGMKIGIWRWQLSCSDAISYYDGVRRLYEDWITGNVDDDGESPWKALDANGSYPSCAYKEVRDVLRTSAAFTSSSMDWGCATKELAERRSISFDGGGKFNAALVIGQVVDKMRRDPTGDDLKVLFERLFRIPMSGKKVEELVGKGGVR